MYCVAFVSLGCAKNQVNCEQMMALCQSAGYQIQEDPAGCDVAVVNTCGFIDSAKEEAIASILEMAALKNAGQLRKILVTGCLAQRYQREILSELPEVDGILGTGSYTEIVPAIDAVMQGDCPCRFGDIHSAKQDGSRILSTPPWFAYLRIAEGCDNHCAYCVIPSLRGKYRSRPMDGLLTEAAELANAGVQELIVVAQDITRYGTDLDGTRQLSRLLRELCRLNFHWIRLHYLYPDELDDELIDTIAAEPKILNYLDIPIQHCNDRILKAMHRRNTKADLLGLFQKLRVRIPDLVLRTSLITGLPYEDDDAFEELCAFLRDVRIERAGVFPFSPEEGTPAAAMDHVSSTVAQQRAERIEEIQSEIMDAYNESILGSVREVLCEGYQESEQMYVGRSYAESPEIDGWIWFDSAEDVQPGQFVQVRLTGTMDGELTGETV